MPAADVPEVARSASGAGGTGCWHGHRPTRSPAVDPRWGFVPSRTNAWFGAVVYVLLTATAVWLLPPSWLVWVVVVLLVSFVIDGAVQATLGHRGRCWLVRTLRWYFGVVGALVDPVDQS